MFRDQVARVSGLVDHADPRETLLVGRSFGAWLVLHALLGRAIAFDGTALLLAPLLGYGGTAQAGFMAPRARTLWNVGARPHEGQPAQTDRVHIVIDCKSGADNAPDEPQDSAYGRAPLVPKRPFCRLHPRHPLCR